MADNDIVIVAIPSDSNSAWVVSSEKVPHMTLLYLGPQTSADTTNKIVEFAEHAAATVHPFFLKVDRRGTLGPKNADVVFFKDGLKRIKDFRASLLQNAAINLAYQSVEQYPEWIPHLTLGFPETPAKTIQDDRDLNYVEFDRIAVWTGDSVGPTFKLKYWDAEEVSMSDESVNNFLHYGVKGMHWGIRRNLSSGVTPGHQQSSSKSKDAAKAERFKARAARGGTNSLSNQELKALVERMNLEQQYARLQPRSNKAQVSKFVGDQLKNYGKQQATQFLNKQISKATTKAVARLLK